MADNSQETAELNRKLILLRELTNSEQQPNFNVIRDNLMDLDFMKMNIKFFGYELARTMAVALPLPPTTVAEMRRIPWKASTQADLESNWARHWMRELGLGFIYHRKLWEIAFFLQNLYSYGMMLPGKKGLGFGCGEEPMPSYLANLGVDVTITDLKPDAREATGWAETGQHTTNLERAWKSHLVTFDKFKEHARLAYVDMNVIPSDLRGFDFCWSICALEHLGTIKKGLDFIENSMETLRPGGIAIHTTEFNFGSDEETIDNWPSVYFLKKHFVSLADALRTKGYIVPTLDFDLGTGVLDRFIDMPPYMHQVSPSLQKLWPDQLHLKLSSDGIASTCFGMVIQKPL